MRFVIIFCQLSVSKEANCTTIMIIFTTKNCYLVSFFNCIQVTFFRCHWFILVEVADNRDLGFAVCCNVSVVL